MDYISDVTPSNLRRYLIFKYLVDQLILRQRPVLKIFISFKNINILAFCYAVLKHFFNKSTSIKYGSKIMYKLLNQWNIIFKENKWGIASENSVILY